MIVSRLRDGSVIQIGTDDSLVLAQFRKRNGRFEITIIAPSSVPVVIDPADKPQLVTEVCPLRERISHACAHKKS